MVEEDLTRRIIGGAIKVHQHWGPGLYEEIYERSLARELNLDGWGEAPGLVAGTMARRGNEFGLQKEPSRIR